MSDDPNAQHYADAAFEAMKRHKVPPTPQNYATWYVYSAKSNAGLVKEIATMLDKQIAFTPEMNEYLYNSYIVEAEDQSVRDATDHAKKMLQEMMGAVQNFSGDTDAYSKAMGEHAGALPEIAGGGELQAVVQQIMQSTDVMQESSTGLRDKLEASKREIEELRQSLAEVTSESEKDFLTAISNRKALETRLKELMIEAVEEDQPLCLMMMDIDHFKKFNDTHGHLIGDQVLKIVAKTLVDSVKGQDIAARYGGEEFCVVLPHTPLVGGMAVANSIRTAIASKELKRKDTGETYGTITVSVGVALYQPGADTIPTLIKRADDALYQSKHKGRNCVTQESALAS